MRWFTLSHSPSSTLRLCLTTVSNQPSVHALLSVTGWLTTTTTTGEPFPPQMWDRLINLVTNPEPACAAAVSFAVSQLIPQARHSLEDELATHVGSWYANLSDKLERQVHNQSPTEWKTDTQKAWEALRRQAAIHFLYVKFKQMADSAENPQQGTRALFDQELRAF